MTDTAPISHDEVIDHIINSLGDATYYTDDYGYEWNITRAGNALTVEVTHEDIPDVQRFALVFQPHPLDKPSHLV